MSDEQTQRRPALPELEAKVAAYGQAIEQGDSETRDRIFREVLVRWGHIALVEGLMVLAARARAENSALTSSLREKERLFEAMLAAPRRLAKVLGIVREERDGVEEPWAVVEGPPHLAVQCVPDLNPEELCPDWPDEPVWTWLIESEGSLVVAGRITPPPLLQAGLEQEMVFEGFLEDEGVDDEIED
jgi:hypothetical protein